jgi:hypothetical protein
VERGDFIQERQSLQLAEALDSQLSKFNMEYSSKRGSLRLGPMRVHLMPSGTWYRWDRQRLARTGGTPEQYKHPCLIPDPHFRDTMPVMGDAAQEKEVLARG